MGQKVSLGRKLGGDGSYSRLSGGENLPGPPAQPAKSQVHKLMFTEGWGYEFDLEDMLRASAEVLGKGSFGTSYKASLENGPTIAVKRLKMETVGRNPAASVITDFRSLVEKCTSIRHENIATLRAYYSDKDERLLVYDYYGRGSMSSLLHGKEGVVTAPMAWEDRLNMAIGAARGLAYIHSQEGGNLVHGDLKPSNIFLGSHGYGIVSEIIFTSLMKYVQQQPITTKYRAPEVAVNRLSQESDVYSFGALLLELLVRKFEPAPSNGEVSDYARWGQIVSREVESGEVFDASLRDQVSILKELQEAFHIGIQCVQELPEERPKMPDVLKRLEGIRGQMTEI